MRHLVVMVQSQVLPPENISLMSGFLESSGLEPGSSVCERWRLTGHLWKAWNAGLPEARSLPK